MWRQPRGHELDAPREYQDLIKKGIYFNRKGQLETADRSEIIQYGVLVVFGAVFLTALVLLVLSGESEIFTVTGLRVVVFVIILAALIGIFYWWGWIRYVEAWYHFDDTNRMFTVIRQISGDWESLEIPYEQVEKVEYSGGGNGYATIHVAGFSFDTSRSSTQRFSSVTEMWDRLARFDANMVNWPITLVCSKCEREFGHHIGTATCPFDKVILTDPDNKGRIDPEEMHPDDYERI